MFCSLKVDLVRARVGTKLSIMYGVILFVDYLSEISRLKIGAELDAVYFEVSLLCTVAVHALS
jgi:hypothetical protein